MWHAGPSAWFLSWLNFDRAEYTVDYRYSAIVSSPQINALYLPAQ